MELKDILSESTRLVDLLSSKAIEFQECFRSQHTSDEDRERVLTQLSMQWNPEPYNVTIRQLEMVGYDEIADAFKEFVSVAHRVITALDPGKYWEIGDALKDINVNVDSLRQKVLEPIERAQEELKVTAELEKLVPPRIESLTEVVILADKMYFLSLEYLSYLEGTCWLGEDDDDESTIEERMRLTAANYQELQVSSSVDWLRSQGLAAASEELNRLAFTISEVFALGEDDVDDQRTDILTATWKRAVEALKSAR